MACRKAGLAPGASLDLSALRGVGSTGAPLPAAGFRWVHDAVSRPRSRWARCAAAPTSAPASSALAARAGLGRRDQLPDARREGRGVRRGRSTGRRPRGRARDHRADAVDAGRVLGRSGRLAATRGVLLDLPRRLAPRRLDDDHRARLVHRHRPQRRDAQARRRPDRDGRVLRVVEALPEVADSLVVHLEDADGGPGELLLFVVPRDGVRARRRPAAADPRRAPPRAVAAPRARRDHAVAVSRGRCPARSSRCPSSGSCWAPGRTPRRHRATRSPTRRARRRSRRSRRERRSGWAP